MSSPATLTASKLNRHHDECDDIWWIKGTCVPPAPQDGHSLNLKRFSSVNVRLLSIVAKKTPSRENSSALGGGGLLAREPEVRPRPRGEAALRFPQVGTCRRLVKATRKPGGCKMSSRFSDWIRTSVGHREFCGSTGRGTRGPPQPPSLRRATAHSHRGQYFTSQSGAFTTGVTISINGRCQNN